MKVLIIEKKCLILGTRKSSCHVQASFQNRFNFNLTYLIMNKQIIYIIIRYIYDEKLYGDIDFGIFRGIVTDCIDDLSVIISRQCY